MPVEWIGKAVFAGSIMILLLSCQTSDKGGEKADLILFNGNIVTVDETLPIAEALAVKGDRILYAGTNEEALSFRNDRTRILDLEGKTAVPGLIDAHMHFPLLGKRLKQLYLDETSSFEEVLDVVKEAVKRTKPGEWIIGSGWHTANWEKKEYPDNRRLNEIAPDNPVYLSGMAIHAVLVNNVVSRMAGIDKDTPDPEGGRILRDPGTQEPTGLFLEKAQGLIRRVLPPETEQTKRENIRLSIQTALRMGLTGVHDAGVGLEAIRLYKEMLENGVLGIRLNVMFLIQGDGEELNEFLRNEPEVGLGNHFLTVRTIKFLIDGAMGARGAAMLDPYSDKPEESGLVAVPREEVRAILEKSLAAGYQVAMHAIGDRGNRIALDAAEMTVRDVPVADPRIRIEHAQILAPEDVLRFSRLGIIPSMQPIHCPMDMGFAEDRVGKDRMNYAYAWRSLIDSGARIAGGSDVPDFPVSYTNPLWGIYAAVTRQNLEGQPEGGWYPEQSITPMEALRMYTIDAAYAAFEEKIKGSLTPGKLADITVLSKNILNIPASEIPETEVVMTILGGKVVYVHE